MQVRLVARGCETVLADAASEAELFLTDDFLTRQVHILENTLQTNPATYTRQLFHFVRKIIQRFRA